jgi:hypothetical protein
MMAERGQRTITALGLWATGLTCRQVRFGGKAARLAHTRYVSAIPGTGNLNCFRLRLGFSVAVRVWLHPVRRQEQWGAGLADPDEPVL